MKEEFLKKLLQYVETTETFLVTETPLYIQEVLEFYFMEELTELIHMLILSALVFIGLFAVYKKTKSWLVEDSTDAFGAYVFLFCFLFFTVFGSSIVIKKTLVEMYKIKYTPKVFIIEYIKGEK